MVALLWCSPFCDLSFVRIRPCLQCIRETKHRMSRLARFPCLATSSRAHSGRRSRGWQPTFSAMQFGFVHPDSLSLAPIGQRLMMLIRASWAVSYGAGVVRSCSCAAGALLVGDYTLARCCWAGDDHPARRVPSVRARQPCRAPPPPPPPGFPVAARRRRSAMSSNRGNGSFLLETEGLPNAFFGRPQCRQ